MNVSGVNPLIKTREQPPLQPLPRKLRQRPPTKPQEVTAHLQLEDFPYCCGAYVLSEFNEQERYRIPTEKMLRQKLKSSSNIVGLVTSILNKEQHEVYHGLLSHYGYSLVVSFNNPVHRNSTCYLYILDVNNYKLPEEEYYRDEPPAPTDL